MKFKDFSYDDLVGLRADLDFFENDEISLKIYNIYRRFFTEYLINKLDLLEYDKLLIAMNLPDNYLDMYKYYVSDYLKYIYVRNNLYITKLTKEEKDFILSMENNNYDESIERFISKTYRRVVNGYGDNTYCFYGQQIRNYSVKSDKIVIGIYYEGYDLTTKEKIDAISKEIEKKLDNVKVLIYNHDTYRNTIKIR